MWTFGSCVEKVYINSRLNGDIWNKNENKYKVLDLVIFSGTKYSSKYYSTSWQRSTAVSNYLSSTPCSLNAYGDIAFKFAGTTKFTLREATMYP